MRRSFAVTLTWVLICAAGPSRAQGAEDVAGEQQAVQDRLLQERAALAALKDQQAGVLELIDVLDRRAQLSKARAQALERELSAFRRQRALVERQVAVASALVDEHARTLGPRLTAMYRLHRRGGLEVLLAAKDFSSLVRRQRALGALVREDLRALAEARAALTFQAQSQRALERLTQTLAQRKSQLEGERAFSTEQQALLSALLQQIGADTKLASRVVRELQLTERRLGRMVEDLESEVEDLGFASLKGRLEWPVPGIIEVSFGKVLNPRFNTVTFRKGLDLRAPPGTPVKAVAPGRVVYAGWLKGYGNLMVVDHGGGFHTVMGHLGGFTRVVGDAVDTAEEVAVVGDSASMKGAYLYFELRKNGIAVDPRHWLGAQGF